MDIIRRKDMDKEPIKQREFLLKPIISKLNELGIGDGLKISPNEWPLRTPPQSHIFRYHLEKVGSYKKFSIRGLLAFKGWMIIRMK